jgi:hypothetical protein
MKGITTDSRRGKQKKWRKGSKERKKKGGGTNATRKKYIYINQGERNERKWKRQPEEKRQQERTCSMYVEWEREDKGDSIPRYFI